MKIIFIGAVEFSHSALKKIVSVGGNVVGVCTYKESHYHSDYYDLSSFAKKNNIPCQFVDNINSSRSLEWISQLKPDVIFCFGWSRLLKREILSITPIGVIGFHPSELPANRGRSPIIWAINLGLKKTASSFFFMDSNADSGDILSQKIIAISDKDDSRSLYDKITKVALSQIEEFLPKLEDGSYKKIKQDASKSNFWRKRTKQDGIIDWRMSANSIHNLIKSLNKPYVGAEFIYNKITYKVWSSELIIFKVRNTEPGKVIDVIDSAYPIIKCGDNAIKLIKIEPKLTMTKGIYL